MTSIIRKLSNCLTNDYKVNLYISVMRPHQTSKEENVTETIQNYHFVTARDILLKPKSEKTRSNQVYYYLTTK